MGEQLTESDVKKIKEEIEYRKIVVRKKELEAVKVDDVRTTLYCVMLDLLPTLVRKSHLKQMKSESIIRSRSILKMMMRQRHIVL